MDNNLFSTAMMKVDPVIEKVSESNLHNPTPCKEWDVEALTNHLINELAWITPLLEGKTIKDVGDKLDGDLIKGNAGNSWTRYCKQASAAMVVTDPASIAHLSYADKPAQAYVDEVAADIIIHGWDLAQALGIDYDIDDKTAEAVTNATKDIMNMARTGGYVGEEVKTTEDASAMEKLLACYGRKNDWKA